ncbi:MAG: glycosyltransferase [Lachnospiraceae bacterium]|nr:glycosyltransferase [Lachnospiraceae bacterium]
MKNTDEIQISVAMCTYNGEVYIREQLESILAQEVPVDEIVIRDDHSADQTVKIASEILSASDVRYEITVNESTLGFRGNFELAIGQTHGDIIFLSDQDDVWMKEKVRIMREHFARNPACLLVFSNADVVDENRRRQSMDLWDSVLLKKEITQKTDWKRLFLKGWYVTGATMAIRRELFEMSAPFPAACYHDAWLAMRAAIAFDDSGDGTVSSNSGAEHLAGASIEAEGESKRRESCINCELPAGVSIEAESARLIQYRQHSGNQIGTAASGYARFRKRVMVLKSAGSNQIEIHKQSALMYQEIWDQFADLFRHDSQFCGELKECIQYHRELSGLENMGFFQKLKVIARNDRSHSFHRFAKTSAAMRGDLIFAFLNPRRMKKPS